MTDAEGGELPRDVLPLGSGRTGVPVTEALARRVDSQLAPGLGIDEAEGPHARERLLSWVADLHGDDVVAPGKREQRAAPVTRPAEVRDHRHECALAGERARPAERRSEGGGPVGRAGPVSMQGEQKPDQGGPALAGGTVRGSPSPNVSTPSRFP